MGFLQLPTRHCVRHTGVDAAVPALKPGTVSSIRASVQQGLLVTGTSRVTGAYEEMPPLIPGTVCGTGVFLQLCLLMPGTVRVTRVHAAVPALTHESRA
ncbi:hypothetical protein NDU88_008122 [Pleurodeles waltl]|uniref:Uncharacterized protein n=1 Tax=Pleurodeles waltl TaxID=8319 RepID=A0AAV7U2D4_PLEWA|nr:hypothetical protein NDU88_008122 [Pleurodeles waltl]